MTIRSRREANRESLRREILDAARPLFVRDGFQATSIRGIAEKAGCSTGILYHYFADKQAIVAELVSETFIVLRARLNAIREDRSPIHDRLRRSLHAYIAFGLENPHHYSLLFLKTDGWDADERILNAFRKDGHTTFACLLALVTEAIEAGEVRPAIQDPEELAQSLFVSIHGLVSAQISIRSFPWIEQGRLIERQVDILLAGIRRH